MNVKDRGVSTEIGTALDAEGPLRRWARRKREAAREEQAAAQTRRQDESDDAPDVRESNDGAPERAVVDEKALTDEDMPPVESLDQDSDYSGFLSPGVSEELRRRALRKLFSSAVFNVPDGLDDYDDDFTSFAALGDIVTSDMKHQAEMEAERAKQARTDAESVAGHEDESGRVEDERLAHAGEDAESLTEVESAGTSESSELPVHEDSDSPGTGTNGGSSEGAELAGTPACSEGGSRDSVSGGRVLAGSAVSEGFHAASLGSGKAAEDGEPARSETPGKHGSADSVAGDHASGDTESTTNASKADHRGT